MACSTQKIKEDSFNRIETLILKDYTVNNNTVKVNSIAEAQTILNKIEDWASKTFGKSYSNNWGIITEFENYTNLEILFPKNLENAYNIKTGISNQKDNIITSINKYEMSPTDGLYDFTCAI